MSASEPKRHLNLWVFLRKRLEQESLSRCHGITATPVALQATQRKTKTMKTKHKLILLTAALAGCVIGNTEAQTCRGPKPTICERPCWNARAPQCAISTMAALDRVVIHHTANAGDYNTSSLTTTKANVRSVQNYHMDNNGWCDIGYHFLVDKLGNILEGRKDSVETGVRPRGAHDGCNEDSYGYNVMGYYHSPYNQNPTSASMNALKAIIAWRMPNGWAPKGSAGPYCGGASDKVLGHREVKATACPGDKLFPLIDDGSGFETDLENRRAGTCN